MNEAGTPMPRRPWYREVWPWALMMPPALAVAGGVMMIWLAVSSEGALVVDDYSRIEEITEVQYERDRRAAELGIEAVLEWLPAPARVELELTTPPGVERPAALLLLLQHATSASGDRTLLLEPDGAVYRAAAEVPAARYHVELMPPDRSWRLASSLLPGVTNLVLTAQPAAH
jgi:hypothetical protein